MNKKKMERLLICCVVSILQACTSSDNSFITSNITSLSEHVHQFSRTSTDYRYIRSNPTCTESATYFYSCDCGEKGSEYFASGDPLGHLCSTWEVKSQPSCTQNEIQVSLCDRCGLEQEKEIPNTKTNHNFVCKVTTSEYLKTAATIDSPAVYYYSCVCGKRGTETFNDGDPLPKNFDTCPYTKSVTYFGSEWPLNFWNSELDNLSFDFEQIKNDGFNSVIIIIPWREFQISTNPIVYNDYSFAKLDEICNEAAKNDLDVYTRIGYTWDFYNDSQEWILDRYLKLINNESMLICWLDYCQAMYKALSKHSNYRESFLTWEDFWGCLSICDANLSDRIGYSKLIGYSDWLKNISTLEVYNEMYGTSYQSFDSIPVPKRNEPTMEAFYIFYDAFINRILRESQKVFPNISLEVRLDADVVTNLYGNQYYYNHQATYSCQNSNYTATMYAIPMGYENIGEKVTAESALQHTDYILNKLLSQNENKPIYVEQFLFLDNTPQFSYNAQIIPEQVGTYLESVSTVLSKYTRGYGIWTYKDYRNNMIYNPGFGLNSSGWNFYGSAGTKISNSSNSNVCELSSGDKIDQKISPSRDTFHLANFKFEVSANPLQNSKIEVTVGAETKTLTINERNTYSLDFSPSNGNLNLSIKVTQGSLELDNLCLYSFVQQGHLYSYENKEMEYISNIRVLNHKLA